MKKISDTILDAIGDTPMVRVNRITKGIVSGTVLARNVEVGEFVTTGFVGDRGAKGYVVSIADLKTVAGVQFLS